MIRNYFPQPQPELEEDLELFEEAFSGFSFEEEEADDFEEQEESLISLHISMTPKS